MEKSVIKKILFITLTNIGDIILTVPVLERLIAEFPEASIDVVAGPNGKELFSAYRNVRESVVYDKKSDATTKLLFYLRLLKKRYDLVVDLRNTVLPVLLFPRYKTNPFRKASQGSGHKIQAHLSRLAEIGMTAGVASFSLPTLEADKKSMDRIISRLGGKPFVVVSPSAKSHVKRWPLKNFALLCDKIKENLGYEIILIGDEYDRIVIGRVTHLMKTKHLNLLEKTNIRELAYLIQKSALLITNDSAPLHVGTAVSASILAFFGPTDEKKYGPATSRKSVVLRKNMQCAPCEKPQCINPENKYGCLKSISVDEAFRAAREILGK